MRTGVQGIVVAQPQSQTKTNPPVRLLAAFQTAFPGQEPAAVLLAPGRDIWVAASPAEGRHYHLYNADKEHGTTFTWRSAMYRRTVLQRPLPAWSRYPAGVIHHLCAQGGPLDLAAVRLVLAADEAPGPGRDYGTGLAVAALWYELAGEPYTQETLIAVVDSVRRSILAGQGSL